MSDAEDESEDVLPPSPAPRVHVSQTTPGSPTSVTGQHPAGTERTPRGSPSASQRTLAHFIFGQRRSTTTAVAAPETVNQIAVVAVRDTEHPPLPVLHIPEADDLVVRPIADDPDVEIVSEEETVGEGSPEVISVDEDSDTDSDTAEEEREVTQPASPVPGTVPETSESLPQAPSDLTEETTQGREPPATSLTPAVISLVDQLESPADFRSPKRRRIFSPPKSTTAEEATGANCADDEEDADCCPICFEDWTTSGSHRLASLRCGHLFGQSCIEKWLKGQGGKCPHCNTKAKRQDIRVLYAKSIKAVDTTERDRALQELQKEREAKKKVEMEAAQTRLQYTLVVEERNRLRTELDRLKQQLQAHRGSTSNATAAQMTTTPMAGEGQGNGQFFLDKTIKIWDSGNCRVMAYSPSLGTLVVSQPSTSPLFPGFGVKKILSLDFKSSQYLTIHSKQIRDVAFHPFVDDGILLSCGLDKMVKMTSIISNAVVQTYETQNPVWSCVWNADDRNIFYAGQTNGTVLEYDIRNTSEHVQELNKEGSRSPVVSLQYIPKDVQATFRQGGLLVGQLNGISFYEKKPDNQHRLHMLPLEGNLTSLCFEPNTRHLLVSFRPTAKHPNSRHQLCEMVSSNLSIDPAVIDNSCTCHVIQTFNGSQRQTVLTRSLLLPHPTDQARMFVCAGEEPKSGMVIWDSSSGYLRQSMSVGGIVVDICAVHANHNTYVAALTEKQLKVFKWT